VTLSPELQEFVVTKFSSLEQLDVFVLLYRSLPRRWGVEEVANELGIAPQSAGMRLFLLSSAGLATATEGTPMRYHYEGTEVLDPVAQVLSELHSTSRPALSALFSGPATASAAQLFADAFRFRKP
jgi:hypothetical protein